LVDLASFWGKECKSARLLSLLGGDAFKDLGTSLFAVCGGDFDRAQSLVGHYIRECANTKQVPTPRELLDMAPKARAQNGVSHGAGMLHISEAAKREHATPRRKGLTR